MLAADAHIQDASLATQGGTAVFRIDGQDQDFAPVPRAAECRGHRRERVIDERIGVARHANRGLAGLQIERFMELMRSEDASRLMKAYLQSERPLNEQ